MSLPGTNYVVLLYGAPQHLPQGICGKSRKTYGFAVYDRIAMAHVLRIPAAVWDPDKKDRRKQGAGKDIMENMRRRQTMNIICEPGVDPQSVSVALAEEIDRLQSRVAELEQGLPLLGQAQDLAAQLLALISPPAETAPSAAPVVTVSTSIERRLEGISFRDLRDVAKRVNAEGVAALKLPALNSKPKMVAALAGVENVENYLPELVAA